MAAKRRPVDDFEDDEEGLVRLRPGQIVIEESVLNSLMAYADRAATRDADLAKLNEVNFTGLRATIDSMRSALDNAYFMLHEAALGHPLSRPPPPVPAATPKHNRKAKS